MSQLQVHELEPGFWRWTAPHPEWTPEKDVPGGWPQQVGCVYHEGADALVLIDPLVPRDGTPEAKRFWDALDRDVERLARPVAVLLANHYHVRSAQAVLDRYRARREGASVWAPHAARIESDVTQRFGEKDTLPGGVRAFAITALAPDETVFHIPSRRTLVAADSILGAGQGRLRLAPPRWAEESAEGQARYRERFVAEMKRLLPLPIERVLVSHGEPALEHGARALAEAFDAPVWGA